MSLPKCYLSYFCQFSICKNMRFIRWHAISIVLFELHQCSYIARHHASCTNESWLICSSRLDSTSYACVFVGLTWLHRKKNNEWWCVGSLDLVRIWAVNNRAMKDESYVCVYSCLYVWPYSISYRSFFYPAVINSAIKNIGSISL